MPVFECIYAPRCVSTFKTKRNMERHCLNAHGGLDRPYCTECDQLKFFASHASLRNHMMTHQPDERCRHCTKWFKNSSVKKHVKNCPERRDNDLQADLSVQDEIDDGFGEIDPLYRAPVTELTRSAHAAPKPSTFNTMMAEYIKWLESPTGMGKSSLINNTKAFVDKFRTTLGRLASFHRISADDLLKRIARGKKWKVYFSNSKLNDFTMSLATTDGGRALRKSTVYNYIRTLIVYFEWKVDAKGCKDMAETLELLRKLGKCLNLQKKGEQDRESKATRFALMPSFPEMLDFLSIELKNKAIAAYKEFQDTDEATWEQYVACRNYILVAMLIGLPPQRATVFDTVSLRDLQEQDGHAILTIKEHKTAHIYGPVVIAIPPMYKKQFDEYLEIRDELCALSAIYSLFIDKKRLQERYLTKRFQAIMVALFNRNITIRDCRSLYVTYASQHLDDTALNKLSRLMFHSFKTQQTIYRSDFAVDRAIASLESTTRALPGMMGMYADDDDVDVSMETEEEPGEFDGVPPDELFLELADQLQI